jgi:hypothetical protein
MGPKPPIMGGQSMSALPGTFRPRFALYRKHVIDLNSQISDRALDFGVPQKELHGPQVTC